MLRLVLSPRWILWHLLTLGAMVTCGLLSAWQWGRAGSALGSAVNVGYGLQWPVFAVFFGVMWWRFLRMELRELRERESREPSDHEPPEPSGREPHEPWDRTTAVPAVDAPNTPLPEVGPVGPSPFTRTPRRAPVDPADDQAHHIPATDADPELAEYNRMLARLAERRGR